MTKPVLILMARWHGLKRCKTRLAKDIGFAQAAEIQKQLTKHTVSVARDLERKGLADVHLTISGIGPKAAKRFGQIVGIQTVKSQSNGCLGLRMRREILYSQRKALSSSCKQRPIIVIGTDLPSLCEFDLMQASSALTTHEMVIGPSNDGGYWLIGLSGKLVNPLISWPFCGIPWGSEEVFSKTINQAQINRIAIRFLRNKNDVDRLTDLLPWE